MESDGQTLAETSVGALRPYLTTDLLWLEDIARKYNEWPGLLNALTHGVAAYVIEPYAIGVVFWDEHGLRLGAMTDANGMKAMIKVCRMMVAGARATETDLHGHWEAGSWQAKLAERYGFVLNGKGYHVMKQGD